MKKGLTYLLVAGAMTVSLAAVSFAMKDEMKGDMKGDMKGAMKGDMKGAMKGHIKGDITKIEGDMVTVKDAEGKEHMLHVDAKATKKEGEIKVGAHVEADADKSGHAKSIKVEAEMSKSDAH